MKFGSAFVALAAGAAPPPPPPASVVVVVSVDVVSVAVVAVDVEAVVSGVVVVIVVTAVLPPVVIVETIVVVAWAPNGAAPAVKAAPSCSWTRRGPTQAAGGLCQGAQSTAASPRSAFASAKKSGTGFTLNLGSLYSTGPADVSQIRLTGASPGNSHSRFLSSAISPAGA